MARPETIITLTGRSPVKIKVAEWPQMMQADWPASRDDDPVAHVRARQNASGDMIVYGTCQVAERPARPERGPDGRKVSTARASARPGRRDWLVRAGYIVLADGRSEARMRDAVAAAAGRVVDDLAALFADRDDDMVEEPDWDALLQGFVMLLPAEVI
jgi:hypothetical protein